VKITELLQEDPLVELNKLLLRSTESRISVEKTEELKAWLDAHCLRVKSDKSTGTLKIFGWTHKYWRAGMGLKERRDVALFLGKLGYKVARWSSDAEKKRDWQTPGLNSPSVSPHVWFW
jgi:hypothetical protein